MNVNFFLPLLVFPQTSQGAVWRTDEHLPELNHLSLLLSSLCQCLEAVAACTSLTSAAVWKLLAKIGKEAQGYASHCPLWAMSSWLLSTAANTSPTSKWPFHWMNGPGVTQCQGWVWDSQSSDILGRCTWPRDSLVRTVSSLPKPAFANDCVVHDLSNSEAGKMLPFAPILTSGCSSQRE